MADNRAKRASPLGARTLSRRRARRGSSGPLVPIPVGGAPGTVRPSKLPEVPQEPDPLGKIALYSTERQAPPFGTAVIECSTCHRRTPVSPIELVRAAFPLSVHLPLIRRYHSFMRCPACGRRTWVRVSWRL